MAALGFFLIIYGFVSSKLNSKWPPLEKIANWTSMMATLVAVFFTAISIYFPMNLREPYEISYFTAAVVIIGVLCALIYSWKKRMILPIHVINGFAILGLTGALFRLLSR